MRAYALQPTDENVKKVFFDNTLDRNKDVVSFCNILDSIEGCFSIALDGKWGSGKTFYVKQAKLILDAYNPHLYDKDGTEGEHDKELKRIKQTAEAHRFNKDEELNLKSQVTVYYDAWQNDNDEDPILSLIYAITQSAGIDFTAPNSHSLLNIAGAVGDLFTGRNVAAALKAFRGENPLEHIEKGKNIEQLMLDFFDALLVERGDRLVIFIDELDRCKPDYAVRLLERIKHYFVDERVTFVFAINTEELQHTIKRYYGEGFHASRYLDRFFELRMSLPQTDIQRYYQSLGFNESSNAYDTVCLLVIKKFNFEMRQIARFLHATKIAASKITRINKAASSFRGKTEQFALIYILPLMMGLRIYDESTYTEFVSGQDIQPILKLYTPNTREYRYFITDSLAANETYDKENTTTDIRLISPQDRIREIYEALFLYDYNGNEREHYVGSLEFDARTRETIIRTANLLSQFADYSM